MMMKPERSGPPGSVAPGNPPAPEAAWSVTCRVCDGTAGRASNVTHRGFFWTCARCGRTERILLAAEGTLTAPASLELWRVSESWRAPLVGSIVLRPGQGFEFRVTRGRRIVRSEVYDDPNVLLTRSGTIWRALNDRGKAKTDVWKSAN
jgi:hypothetical protein